MDKTRFDQALVEQKFTDTRSKAENLIKLGQATVDGRVVLKPGFLISKNNEIKLINSESYVSRAGLKLAGANKIFKINFKDKTVLDVGSSTGGFTDYALQNGAKKVIAVDVGTAQLHPKLRADKRVELYEKLDARRLTLDARAASSDSNLELLTSNIDIILIDVSFISLRAILPYIAKISGKNSQILAMVKPQFEAGREQTNKGVIKNDRMRRQILKDFEVWVKELFVIKAKADNDVAGAKGNQERFYLLKAQ